MIGALLAFIASCAVASFVCTLIREDFDAHLLKAWARLFGLMVGGIGAFALCVQILSAFA
ncbi:MAG: hypothetical protein R3F62_04265 [Planctomycetota bacterium]